MEDEIIEKLQPQQEIKKKRCMHVIIDSDEEKQSLAEARIRLEQTRVQAKKRIQKIRTENYDKIKRACLLQKKIDENRKQNCQEQIGQNNSVPMIIRVKDYNLQIHKDKQKQYQYNEIGQLIENIDLNQENQFKRIDEMPNIFNLDI